MNTHNFLILCFALLFVASCGTDPAGSAEVVPAVINIDFTGPIPIDKKIRMSLRETSPASQMTHTGKIERRGGFSIVFDKHSYGIDLKEDVSLAGLPADDDWILNANYIDKTFLRHVLSFELFAAMSDNNIAPRTRYVEVELNGAYNGLYVLMEKIDKSTLGLTSADTAAFVFKEPHVFRATYEGATAKKPGNFHHQTFPKIKKEDRREHLEGLRQLILAGSDEEFTTRLPTLMDLDNVIDWHLLLLITNNADGILKNFYLYKQRNDAPIRIAPWDYDHSFGRDGDNELNLDERPLDIERSILFKRLLTFDWYTRALRQRWTALNATDLLSAAGLKQRVTTKSQSIAALADKNFARWPTKSRWYFDANGFDEEVAIVLQFIDLRHRRLVRYFEEL